MNSTAAAEEINRLHEQVVRQTESSRQCLDAALAAAWRAGRLLLDEQKQVRRTMGNAWLLWLEQNFKGTPRTAQNYMRLAETVADVAEFRGLSLRQVYLRLGIATEPKSRAASPHVGQLPAHVRLANRLLATLQPCADFRRVPAKQQAAFRQDLRALYERLRALFEADAANNAGPALSKHIQP
jgi:hypothetical protein